MLGLRACVCTLATLLLVGIGVSCGGSKLAGQPGDQPAPPAPVYRGEVSLNQMLADLDALPTPKGVSATEFASLKDALRQMLLTGGQAKFTSKAPAGKNKVEDLTDVFLPDETKGIQWNYRNIGDYDLNSQVNINDLTALGQNYGKTSEAPDWEAKGQFADGDDNGEVNIADITPIGQNLLSTINNWRVEGGNTPTGPFLEVETVAWDSGQELLPSHMHVYVLDPAQAFPYYRVVPLDDVGANGVPSNVSEQYVLSPRLESVGEDFASQVISYTGNMAVIQFQHSNPTTIAVGDVLAADDGAGGFILKIETVSQAANLVTVTGTSGDFTDIFLQGALDLNVADNRATSSAKGASAIPPEYEIDLTGQTVHNANGLNITITSGGATFFPTAILWFNVNKYNGIDYVKAEVTSDTFGFIANVDIEADNFTGTASNEFNLLPVSFPFAERLDSRVPIPGVMGYKIDLGCTMTGSFNGHATAATDSTFTPLTMGSTYKSGVWSDVNTITPLYNSIPAPVFGPNAGATGPSGDFQLKLYMKITLSGKFFGVQPVDLAQNDVFFEFSPFVGLNATRTTSPSDGYNYELNGGLDDAGNLRLQIMGEPSLEHAASFPATPTVARSGFIPDGGGSTTWDVGGTVTAFNPSTFQQEPKAGVQVIITRQSDGTTLGVDVTDASGLYSVLDLADGDTVIVTPGLGGFTFTGPGGQQSYTVLLDSDKTVNWSGVPSLGWIHSWDISGPNVVSSGYGAAMDQFGNVFVAGESDDYSNSVSYATLLMYNPGGALLKAKHVSGGGGARLIDIAFDELTGTQVAVGAGGGDLYTPQYGLITKWNLAAGTEAWTYSWESAGVSEFNGVVIEPFTGTIYAAGSDTVAGDTKGLFVCIDTDGNLVWQKYIDSAGNDWLHDVALAGTNVAAVGETDQGGNNDFMVCVMQPSGFGLWTYIYDVAGRDGLAAAANVGQAIARASDGTVYVTGTTTDATTAVVGSILKINGFGGLLSTTNVHIQDDLTANAYLNALKLGRSDNELLLAGYYGDPAATYETGFGLTVDNTLAEVGSGNFTSPTGFSRLYGLGFNPGSAAVALVGSDTRAGGSPGGINLVLTPGVLSSETDWTGNQDDAAGNMVAQAAAVDPPTSVIDSGGGNLDFLTISTVGLTP